MVLKCEHIVLSVSDVAKAREFYLDQLGFENIEDHENSFSFSAGSVRFSISPNGQKLNIDNDPANSNIIFRTENLEKTVLALKERGIKFSDEIREAPGFMKFISLDDPDNNPIMIAQYFRNPTKKV